MWTEELTALAEFLGIPFIIILPLAVILYVLFKSVLPKMLNNNTKLLGRIVISIVSQLFDEGSDNELVEGVTELEVAKTIKTLPSKVDDAVFEIKDLLSEVVEIMVLTNEIVMSERFIKPGNDALLRELNKKSKDLIDKLNVQEDTIEEVIEDADGTNNDNKD